VSGRYFPARVFVLSFVFSCLIILDPAGGLRVDAYGDVLPPGAAARLGSARWRCPTPPDHLIWSPDGKHLVGTHGGRSLTIWTYPAGVVTGRFEVPAGGDLEAGVAFAYRAPPTLTPDQVRFAADGRSMLVYGGRHQLYRVSVPDGRGERIPVGGPDGVARAVSADGRRMLLETNIVHAEKGRWSDLVVVDRDDPTRPRTVLAGRQTHRKFKNLTDEPLAAAGVALSPDGRFALADLITEDGPGRAAIDLRTGQRWNFEGRRVGAPAFASGGRGFLSPAGWDRLVWWSLVSAGDGPATRLDLAAQTEVAPDGPRIDSVCLSPDDRYCVIGYLPDLSDPAAAATFAVLDARTLRPARTWSLPVDMEAVRERGRRRGGRPGTALAVAPDGRALAVASAYAPLIRFFNLDTGTEIVHQGGHGARVTRLAIDAAGMTLASVSADQSLRVWGLGAIRNGPAAAIRESDVRPHARAQDVPAGAAGRHKLVYDPERDRMQLRDRATEDLVREFPDPVVGEPNQLNGDVPAAVSADGWWAAYRQDDNVVVCDSESGLRVATFRMAESRPTVLEFVPGTDLLVVGYHDGQILVWHVRPSDLPDREPTAADFEQAWADLVGDARGVVRARSMMLAHPAAATGWLGERLRAIPHPTEYDIDLWLARLSHRRDAVREEAARQLARHFDVSEGPMREVLAVTRSLEVETRLRALLDSQTRGGDAEAARLVRLVAVLERMRTPKARELLFRIARGAGVPSVRATDALERWPGDEGRARDATRPGPSR
jgi:hypothetical protein